MLDSRIDSSAIDNNGMFTPRKNGHGGSFLHQSTGNEGLSNGTSYISYSHTSTPAQHTGHDSSMRTNSGFTSPKLTSAGLSSSKMTSVTETSAVS